MTPIGQEKKQGWSAMRQNLNIDVGYLSFITDESKGPRHGNRTGIKQTAFREVIRRSWSIMDRFLEYKKRGDKQLPLADFPLLTK